jgi:hypothetical protein
MKEKEPRPIETLAREEAVPGIVTQTFARRLLNVIDGASYVQKKGRNKEQGYNYAQEADFLELIKPLLIANGILPIPSYEVIGNEQVQTQSGKPANLVTVLLTLSLHDVMGTSNEQVVITSIGQGRDPQDKACYKAMTGAMKYALAKAFLVPTGDDPEDEEEKDSPAAKEKPKEAAKPVAKAVDNKAFHAAVEKEITRIGMPTWTAFLNAHELTYPNAVLGLSDEEKRAFYKELIALKGAA